MTTFYTKRGNQEGFTLVELLIVAIILAILAAIVVPQFANTTQNAGASALRSDLSAIRSAIELYSQQHNGSYPGSATAVSAACTATTTGVGLAGSQQAFDDQLTLYTNAAGGACGTRTIGGVVLYPFGPYLKTDVVPTNPVTGSGTVTMVSTGDLGMTAPAAGGGWRFDSVSGKFIADDNSTDANGTRYDSY